MDEVLLKVKVELVELVDVELLDVLLELDQVDEDDVFVDDV